MKQYPRDRWEVGKTRASGLPPLALSLAKDSLLDEPYNLCKGASQPSSICDLPWDTCLELFRRS